MAHTREEATQIVRAAFETAHSRLKERGLKMDQVKCELIHFTKSNRGRHRNGPLHHHSLKHRRLTLNNHTIKDHKVPRHVDQLTPDAQ